MKDQTFISLQEATNQLSLNIAKLFQSIKADLESGSFCLLHPPGLQDFRESSSNDRSAIQYFSFPTSINRFGLEANNEAFQKLLRFKIDDCLLYFEKILARLNDNTCRILVTGDINAGKSTFVNALLRQEILPMDEQPCTQCFCEVLPLSKGEKTMHITGFADEHLTLPIKVDVNEFRKEMLSDQSNCRMFRIYIPQRTEGFMGNSSLDVSLIDSPGLNCDVMKTTSLFAKQEDIDVVIFVIDAANHLTLSAKEFLSIVGREKLHIFVVINKFDSITNIEKCELSIMRQIQESLPYTYSERTNLVHFIGAYQFLRSMHSDLDVPCNKVPTEGQKNFIKGFLHLESKLTEFVFENKAKSKFLPICNYYANILKELGNILEYNLQMGMQQLRELESELAIIKPCYENLRIQHDIVARDLKEMFVETCTNFQRVSMEKLSYFKYAEIILTVPWLGILNVPKFFVITHERLISAQKTYASFAKKELQEILDDGLSRMKDHALSSVQNVFEGSDFDCGMKCSFPLETIQPSCPSLTSLLFEMAKKHLWVLFATASGSILSFNPFVKISTNLIRQIFHSKTYMVVVLLSLGVAIPLYLLDPERIFRGGLERHYRDAYADVRELGVLGIRDQVAQTREAIAILQARLTSKYERVYERQRIVHSSKELESTKIRNSIKKLEHAYNFAIELNQAAHCLKIKF